MLPESPQNVPSPVGHGVSLDHPSTNLSISAAKILLTLPKSNLYLQHETKIMKSGEKRADDQIRARFQQISVPVDTSENL